MPTEQRTRDGGNAVVMVDFRNGHRVPPELLAELALQSDVLGHITDLAATAVPDDGFSVGELEKIQELAQRITEASQTVLDRLDKRSLRGEDVIQGMALLGHRYLTNSLARMPARDPLRAAVESLAGDHGRVAGMQRR